MKIKPVIFLVSILALIPSAVWAQNDEAPVKLRNGALIQVNLPITSEVGAQVEKVLLRHMERAPANSPDNQKPVLVLEFDTSNNRNGRGSRFEACLQLARFLTKPQMNRVQTVAYIPEPKGFVVDAEVDSKLKSELLGHANLVAMACNHIAMHVDASLGEAGIDEESVDQLVIAAYRDIANKRFRFPEEFAVAMVDPSQSLHRIQTTENKFLFGNTDKLNQLLAEKKVENSDTITAPGSLPRFDSNQLMEYQLLRYRVNSRRDIARRFSIKQNALQGAPSLGKKWVGVQIDLDRVIDQRTVSWVINALNQRWKDDSENNLLVVKIDPSEVDIGEAIRLARHLATFDSSEVQTIAYVPKDAINGAGIIALACDHLVLTPKSSIGGNNRDLDKQQVAELMGAVRELAEEKNRDWSLMAAMLDPNLKVFKYRNKASQIRLLSKAEHEALDDKDQWLPTTELSLVDGMDAQTASECYVATYLVDDFEQLKSFYQITDELDLLSPTLADRWIENLATFLASPMVAFWLLFGAMFFLSSEMSQPGIGIPGFIGVILILLFFWSQFLDGNAEVFEIMLFVVGVICIAVELFVLPGFGVFGFGGLLLVVTSIILATQKFGLLPRNSEELRQLPISMLMVLGAGLGCIVAMIAFRKLLPNMPVLRRLMLTPPTESDDELVKLEDREAVVNWAHLVGQAGMSLTPLMPTGKAQFGGDIVDVITDGRLIENKTRIVVKEVNGNVVRVEAFDSPSAE